MDFSQYNQYSDDDLAQIANAPVSNAILGQESDSGKNSKTSVDGAVGQGQITPDTWVQYAKPGEKIDNPDDNLAVHHRIINDLSNRFAGDPARIAVGYFSGPGNVAPPDSPTPYIKDTKDGNGKSVSSYVADVNGRLPRQVADNNQVASNNSVQTDAQVDAPKQNLVDFSQYSQYSDDELAKIAGTQNAQESPQTANPSAEGRNVNPSLLGQWWNNTAEAAKNAATATGEAMSEPLNSPNVPDNMKIADAAVRTLGKLGNAVGGTFNFLTSPGVGAMTTGVERSGIIPSSAQWIKENLVPNDPRFSANIPPDVQHQVAMGIGSDLNNAFLMALGAKKGESGNIASEELTTKIPSPPEDSNDSGGGGGGGGNESVSSSPLSFLKDESSGGAAPPGAPGGFPIPKLVVDNTSGSPNPLEHIFKPKEPLPQSLLTTDSGQPLLVTRDSIPKAQEDIKPFLENDGINLNKVADQLEQAKKVNPNITALDVMAKDEGGIPGGSNVMGLAKSIAQSPGQGRTMAAEMTNRGYTASQRIADTFDNNISKAPYYKIQNDSIQQMDGSGDLYQKAYAANQDVSSPVINRLLKTDAGKEALGYAANRMNTKMSLMGVPDPELAEQAQLTGQYQSGGISKGLKLQTMQYVKEGYDNQISRAFAAGEKGKAGDLIEQKNGLLSELDKIDQENSGGLYAKARQTYATAAKVNEALEHGRNFMNLDPEEIQSYISDKNRSNPEKIAFATGARRALQDKIDNSPETRNPINALWKPNLQKRLQSLFPDKQSYDTFAENMEHEKTMARVNGIVQGSPTFQNAEFSKKIAVPQTKLGHVAREIPFGGSFIGEMIDKKLAQNIQTMSQNSKTIIMRYLTTKDPELLRDLAKKTGQTSETKVKAKQ